ncbi:MAG: BMC domain-containing protein [Phycisphaerae bacterium]|nr:BMC domain-containing protein [Phycisphaerae bacterium]
MSADVEQQDSAIASVGLVEVMGLSASLVVADVMVKAANVRLAGIEVNHAGGMGVKVTGRAADVRASVQAGREIAEQMHALLGGRDWASYAAGADFLVHSAQEYNTLLGFYEHMLPGGAGASPAADSQGAAMAAQDAIGFIETQGLVGLLEAADTMCKAADVKIIGKEKIGAAYVTVMVTGDVAAVKAAVQAGAAAVERVGGKLILGHVIARPHDELAALLPK